MALSSQRTPLSTVVSSPYTERIGIGTWTAATAYVVGQIVQSTASSGAFYQCTVAGTSGSSPPSWTTTYATVSDNGITWQYIGAGNGGDLVLRPNGLTAFISGLQNIGNMLIATFDYVGILAVPKASGTVFASGSQVFFNLATGLAVTTMPTYGMYLGSAQGNAASGTTSVTVMLNQSVALLNNSAITYTGSTGANSLTVPTNLADALDIVDSAAVNLVSFVTTTGSPAITLNANTTVASGKQLNTPKLAFNAATGSNIVSIVTNLADALTVKDTAGSPVSFLTFVTTTATPSVQVKQNMALAAGMFLDGGWGTFAAGLTGGKTALTKQFCYVTCADASHVYATLPAPAAGRFVFVSNNSAQTADVYPNASETINNTTHLTIATYKSACFLSDGTNWIALAGA